MRCSALSLSYNLAVGLFGGLAPMLVTWLIYRTNDDMVPALALMAIAAIVLAAALRMPDGGPAAAVLAQHERPRWRPMGSAPARSGLVCGQ